MNQLKPDAPTYASLQAELDDLLTRMWIEDAMSKALAAVDEVISEKLRRVRLKHALTPVLDRRSASSS